MKIDIEREVAALKKMSTGQLCERYAELFGEPTRTRNRTYLIRKIAWKMQALIEGGLTERARQRAEELARNAELRVMPPKVSESPSSMDQAATVVMPRDARLPAPGTALVRRYKGHTFQVLVLPDGFEFEGQRYKSLSAVAKRITGSHVNGYRFFGLESKK
ncbi:MAG: hypothetical protein KatS3mg109_0651 [Pirellulaceae bacterium]|nr:MAG: hypothetical protein KatS3mg109_0651 [Pirellulaceae bacterium]